jgi:hypothetical protein
MSIPIEITKLVADEIAVAVILESWSIEEIRQFNRGNRRRAT